MSHAANTPSPSLDMPHLRQCGRVAQGSPSSYDPPPTQAAKPTRYRRAQALRQPPGPIDCATDDQCGRLAPAPCSSFHQRHANATRDSSRPVQYGAPAARYAPHPARLAATARPPFSHAQATHIAWWGARDKNVNLPWRVKVHQQRRNAITLERRLQAVMVHLLHRRHATPAGGHHNSGGPPSSPGVTKAAAGTAAATDPAKGGGRDEGGAAVHRGKAREGRTWRGREETEVVRWGRTGGPGDNVRKRGGGKRRDGSG